MLTPVDVQNKIFKGGIGYDKKEVESFMREIAADYESLYRSNVELKDKVTTLNESLQHYRSIEDSMQKALTLSEKTAEETINAANDKGRQVTTEAEKKAEGILEDAKKELSETKNEIYRLQQQYAEFKKQYTKILYMQLKGLGEEVLDIDLGESFEADITYEESSSNDGLSGLGAGGGYTGSSSLDDRFERTNQESAFGNMGSLNMDPFGDAMNGGGRFSKKSSKTFSNNSNKNKSDNVVTNNEILHKDKKSSEPIKDVNVSDKLKPEKDTSSTVFDEPKAKQSPSAEEKVIRFESSLNKEKVVSGEVESSINESNRIGNKDNDSEGFNFIQDVEDVKKKADFIEPKAESLEEKGVVFSNHAEEAITGEVEDRINEATMLDSEDNYDEGFSFINDQSDNNVSFDLNSTELDEDTYIGEVEDRVNESTMLESEDDASEGFNFLVGNEDNEDDIPTIFPNLHTINVTAAQTWQGVMAEETTEEEEEEIRFV